MLCGCEPDKKKKGDGETPDSSASGVVDAILDTNQVDSTPGPVEYKTEFIANLRSPLKPHTNLVYSVGLQLAWDKMSENTQGEIRIENGPLQVMEMNRAPGSFKDISKKWSIGLAAVSGPQLQTLFAREFSAKFHGHDTIVPEVDSGGIALIGFAWKPTVLGFSLPYYRQALSMNGVTVDAFGIGTEADAENYGGRVTIHHYNGPEDFVVSITSDTLSDRLVVARLKKPDDLFLRNYYKVRDSLQNGREPGINPGDRLLIPAFHFQSHQHFREFNTGPIQNPEFRNMHLVDGLNIYRVGLGNDQMMSGRPDYVQKGRRMLLDKPFLLMLIEKDAPYPWFAMWVNNQELMWTGN